MLWTIEGTVHLIQRKDQLLKFAKTNSLPWLEAFVEELLAKGFAIRVEGAQENGPESRKQL